MDARATTCPGWLVERPIAHRGLHNEAAGIIENSLTAFQAAIDNGYAIECDIRLSADDVPFVFHDDLLERLTGTQGRFRELDAAAVGALRLKGTAASVPTFAELLDLVAGRVPLVVELKGGTPEDDAHFCERIRPLLESYDGPLALMSFAPWLVEGLTAFQERHPVGLTAEGLRADQLERHRAAFQTGCNFVSYNVHHLDNPFVAWVRETVGAPVISWTVRTPDDVRRSERGADQMTFEGFQPPAPLSARPGE